MTGPFVESVVEDAVLLLSAKGLCIGGSPGSLRVRCSLSRTRQQIR